MNLNPRMVNDDPISHAATMFAALWRLLASSNEMRVSGND